MKMEWVNWHVHFEAFHVLSLLNASRNSPLKSQPLIQLVEWDMEKWIFHSCGHFRILHAHGHVTSFSLHGGLQCDLNELWAYMKWKEWLYFEFSRFCKFHETWKFTKNSLSSSLRKWGQFLEFGGIWILFGKVFECSTML